jgi:hypothetical protein
MRLIQRFFYSAGGVALRVHAEIEEEIFYPAFLDATTDRDMHHEAIVEHAGAKALIAQIEAMSAGDEYFEAKVTVLSEMIPRESVGLG